MPLAQCNEKDYSLYNSSARHYDDVRFTGRAGQWGHQRQLKILARLVDDWQGKNVLEIGCGTGRITEMLVQWGATVAATDISSEMLKVARRRFHGKEAGQMPSFRVMSVSDTDIDLHSFEYIIMINVFGRLSNAAEAITLIAERMAPSSHFVFTFPCLTSVLFGFGSLVNARGTSLSRDVTSRWYTPKAIEAYCTASGLRIQRFLGNHYVPVPRLLFWSLPFFWVCDKLLADRFPARCPSVFVECVRTPS